MKGPLMGVVAFILVMLMISGGCVGVVTAKTPSDPMDRIRLELGTTNEFGSGSYVAINCTQGASLAWFGVVYGTEQNPAPITLVGMNLRYLGGAEVVDPNGNVIVSEVPIPIVTVFGQQMFSLIEFDDTGIATFFGDTYGDGNGLFDFKTGKRMFEDDPYAKYEPVYKYIDLNRSWKLSAIEQSVDYDAQTKTYTFSLYAENVTYTKVWDRSIGAYRDGNASDGLLGRIEFRFHIEASAKEVTVEVPFYQVTISNGDIVSSQAIEPRNCTGVSTQTAFKYDHIIEGWDFDPLAVDPRLMLENGIIYATFIPDKVEEWYNAQFVNDNVDGASGAMSYTTSEGEQKAETNGDLPDESTLLTKDRITFEDNWERTGVLTWVSNVTVDGVENRSVCYQVHGADDSVQQSENRDGNVMSLLVLGGYIYPAGTSIMHDPLLEIGAIQLDMSSGIGGLIFVGLIGAFIICAIVVTVGILVRHKLKQKGNFDNQVPPPYRP